MLVGAVLVATICMADLIFMNMQREAAFDSYGRSISNLAEGYANSLSHFLTDDTQNFKSCGGDIVAHATEMRAGLSREQRRHEVTDRLLECQNTLQGGLAAAIYDADGELFASSKRWAAPSSRVAGEDFFRALQAHGRGFTAVSRPLKGSNGGPSTFVAWRLNDRNGGFAGAAALELSLNGLEDYYKVALPARRIMMFVREDGVILMHSPKIEGLRGTSIAPRSPWFAASATDGLFHEAATGQHGAYLATAHKVPNKPLVVEVAVLESDVLADTERRKPWMVAIGIAACAIVLLVLRSVAAHLSRVEQSKHVLEQTQVQLHATLSHISQGVSFFASDQQLVVSNRRYAEIYGLPPDSVRPGMSLSVIMELCRAAGCAPVTVPAGGTAAALKQLLAAGDCQIDVELGDGRVIAMQQRCMPGGGWVATHEDITARREAEKNIAFLAHHDPLTGLANRAQFQDVAGRALTDVSRGAKFAVLFLDLDRFKVVNDTMGHKAGDDLLVTVSQRLQRVVRKTDTIARFGGDEFAILQSGTASPEATLRLAERIIHALSEPIALEGGVASVGVSIGIAMAPEDGTTPDTLLKNADLALYLAKSEGRGTFRFFEPEMDARQMRRHEIERDMRRAIAEEQFELHYQPVINIATGAVAGFEALIRWSHPEKGFLPPVEFIGIAETCGLIIPIGTWVLRQACRQATGWPENIRVAVNLSPIQFRAPGLVETVAEALAQSGLAPGRLELEITESVLLASSDDNVATLHRLRDLGVTIAMDDFGVGYSSLSYLHCFPFDRIKIDRSFVNNMTSRHEALAIVRAVIGLCRDLDVHTTVEGVETEEQLAILRREKASHVQGYFFSRPMPALKVAGFLAKRQTQPREPDPKMLAMAIDGAGAD